MRPSGPKPEMNVTPLVDVVLVLLIIFMVVTPQMEAGAAVELPTAVQPRRPQAEEGAVHHRRDQGRQGLLREEHRGLDRPDRRPRAAQGERPDRASLRIKGDYRSSYGQVREVFRVAQDVGFPGIGIQVIDKNKPSGG